MTENITWILTIFAFLSALFNLIAGEFFLRKKIRDVQVVGGVMIAAGVLLFVLSMGSFALLIGG
tara:strand:+ start:10513 stop:10704 length:192 start_codon:yes stop_codon:yes gene_type:complete